MGKATKNWLLCTAPAAVLLLASPAASADAETRCPIPDQADKSLASVDAASRLDFLHETIDEQGHFAHKWRWWWFAIGDVTLAASVSFAIVGATSNDQPNLWDRPDFVDGLIVSAFSVVTPLSALILAPRAEGDAEAIDRLFTETGNGRAGECEVLARTEEIFMKTRDEEAFNAGWFMWTAAILGNAAMFTIMAVEAATARYDPVICGTTDPKNPPPPWCEEREAHWRNAIVNTASGLVLTSLQILTSPTGAVSGWGRYLKGDVKRKSAGAAFSVTPFALAPGLALSVRF